METARLYVLGQDNPVVTLGRKKKTTTIVRQENPVSGRNEQGSFQGSGRGL